MTSWSIDPQRFGFSLSKVQPPIRANFGGAIFVLTAQPAFSWWASDAAGGTKMVEENAPAVPKARNARPRPHLALLQFRELEAVLRARGYDDIIEWSETVMPPTDARTFAKEAIYVICNSGMNFHTANGIYWKCLRALRGGHSSSMVFGHVGKTNAIDHIWIHRKVLFAAFEIAENKLAYCHTLPFIGPITKHHLAKNFGLDTIKPDVHLMRLARAERVSPMALCARLAYQTGYRQSTIDSILWRACADRYLESATYVVEGWYAATGKLREELRLIDSTFLRQIIQAERDGWNDDERG